MPSAETLVSYEEIFNQQAVPERFRGPDDYFFHRVTEQESADHAGEVYAIPSQVHVRGDMYGLYNHMYGLYNHQENGAIIEHRAAVDADVTVGPRSIVHNASLGKGVEIGAQSTVGAGAHLTATEVGNGVKIAGGAEIDMADIGHESKLGNIMIGGGQERSIIGMLVTMEDGVHLDGDNRVGDHTELRRWAALSEGVELGEHVLLEEGARVLDSATVKDGSYVTAGSVISIGKTIRANTFVYPKLYKRARKSAL